MTVVVGFCSDEGIVIASDSQLTSGFTRHSKQKVWVVDSPCRAFGVAGIESTTDLLADYLLKADFDTNATANVRATLTKAVDVVLKPEYERVISLLPSAQATADNLPQGAALIGIYSEGKPHLFDLSAFGHITDHATRGFATIGSGNLFAEHAVTIFSDLLDGMTLHQAKMLAFRITEATITAAGSAIGGPVQMAIVTPGPPPKAQLLPVNDAATSEAVEGWKRLEMEHFHQHGPLA